MAKLSHVEQFLHSILDSQIRSDDSTKGAIPVVAINREYGAGGDHIGRHLAKILGVPIYDKEILDSVASAANVDSELMEKLDDKIRDTKSAWLRGIFSANTAYPESYRHHLVDVLLGIAQVGGIIMGRGAHIILSDRKVFRLRVTGSEERCAERIAEREAMNIESARVKVAAINQERAQFLWEMFHEQLNNPVNFDLIINTDRFEKVEDAVNIVLMAMLAQGFSVPHPYNG
jgi:hypothetical protein